MKQWIKWQPTAHLDLGYCTESITEDKNSLKIVFFETNKENHELHVCFSKLPEFYMVTEESFALSYINDVSAKYDATKDGASLFFEVVNSTLIQELLHDNNEKPILQHLLLMTGDCIIEIITSCQPTVTPILNKN